MTLTRYTVTVEMVVRGCSLENHYLSVGAESEADALKQVSEHLENAREVTSFKVLSVSESLTQDS